MLIITFHIIRICQFSELKFSPSVICSLISRPSELVEQFTFRARAALRPGWACPKKRFKTISPSCSTPKPNDIWRERRKHREEHYREFPTLPRYCNGSLEDKADSYSQGGTVIACPLLVPMCIVGILYC